MRIGPFTHEEFMEEARKFHGYPAPGLIIGGYMVELARSHMPQGILYDAISETTYCLPDAIQMLTPCTYGNGWLRVLNLGLYGMSLFDKSTGQGVRVRLDAEKLGAYPSINTWLMKTTPKREQDTDQLQEEIYEAGISILTASPISVKTEYIVRRDKGSIVRCALCGEPHPSAFGLLCRSCQGDSPYSKGPGLSFSQNRSATLRAVPVAEAVGKQALHDMTRIEPGLSKGPAVLAGQVIGAGDLCRLQLMGRNQIYLDNQEESPDWLHENNVAQAFAQTMPGVGIQPNDQIKEGKIGFRSEISGLLCVDVPRLEALNLVPDVMCATRRNYSLVPAGVQVAGSRSIPLYLSRERFLQAQNILGNGPLFSVLPLRKANIGILITGTEVFQGLIEDRFGPLVEQKALALGCHVCHSITVPDNAKAIRDAAKQLLDKGADLIITTAGLSVDPDDVTRKGLAEAGLVDMLYGMPLLPGAMSLVGKIGSAQVLGVPACALFHKITALDILLPPLLANAPISREFLSTLGNGGLCMDCKTCSFPKCLFGR